MWIIWSTLDHLVRLENEVRRAFAADEHQVSIFFDLEKAYDMTWKYFILNDLYMHVLRGLLPKYIKQFLSTRQFAVRIKNHLSNMYQLANWVPQGSVLPVTLLAIKIDSVAKLIPQNGRFISSLYVDDLQIGYRHTDQQIINEELQQCLSRTYK